MSSLSTEPYKGTRDWYPADMRLREYIFAAWRKVARSYGYEAYDAPLLEPVDVYEAKSGQELVSEQTYAFTDRGDRHVAIRPEMTPSVSRMIAARQQEIAMPARWYSIAQYMRYERPQRGREREFWQLNCDLFGIDGAEAEAEIIAMGAELLRALGADPVSLDALQARTGLPTDRLQAQLLDLELDGQVGRLPGQLFQRIATL